MKRMKCLCMLVFVLVEFVYDLNMTMKKLNLHIMNCFGLKLELIEYFLYFANFKLFTLHHFLNSQSFMGIGVECLMLYCHCMQLSVQLISDQIVFISFVYVFPNVLSPIQVLIILLC